MRFRVIALAEDDFKAWLTTQKSVARTVTPAANAQPKAQFVSYEPMRKNAPGWTPGVRRRPDERLGGAAGAGRKE